MGKAKFALLFGLVYFCLPVISAAQHVPSIDFSEDRGFFTNSFSLSLATDDPLASIRYTLNGDAPSPVSGTVYTGPITISTTSFVRAIAFNADTFSTIITHTYLYLNDVINQPNSIGGYPAGNLEFDASLKNDPIYGNQLIQGLMDIPSISLVMAPGDWNTLYSGNASVEVATSMELIDPLNQDEVHENCGIKRAGGSSFNSAKRNLRLVFREQYGTGKLRYEFFGEDGVDEHDQIALRPGYHGCIIRDEGKDINDQLLRNLQIYTRPDSVGIRGFFAHLYINGVYWGVYNPSERANNGFGEAYYGGNKEDWDAIKRKLAMDGTIDAWNTLNNMVNSQDMSLPANYLAVQEYIDVEQFIDYVIVCNYGPHSDVHPSGKNSFVIRDRTKTEGFKFYVWDTEPALWSTWRWTNSTHDTPPYNNLWNGLRANSDFVTLIGDRLYCHAYNDGPLSPDFVMAEYMKLYNQTEKAFISEAARWKNKTIYEKIFAERDSNMMNFLPGRTDVLVNTYRTYGNYPSIDAVLYSQHGGQVPAGYTLGLTNPNANGTIYFTTDNTDPRASGGAISPTAQTYSAVFTLPYAVTEVKARVKDVSTWSAACPVRFYSQQDFSGLVINELQYHPDTSCSAEFIEIKNSGAIDLDLTDCYFSDGIQYRFPMRTTLAPGAFIVLARNADQFQSQYGFAPDGDYEGKLSNDGERIILVDPLGTIIDSVLYNDKSPWDTLADGHGPSLELLSEGLDNSLAANWMASDPLCGTPKAENSRYCLNPPPEIVINELNYNFSFKLDGLDGNDWIELYNPHPFSVDLSHWQIEDEDSLFRLPVGLVIQPNEFIILTDSLADFLAVHPGVTSVYQLNGFGLSSKGEQIFLRDSIGCPSYGLYYDNKSPWPEEADGEGFSLMLSAPNLDPENPGHWLASGNYAGTPGDTNTVYCIQNPPLLVINEINYKSAPANDSKDWVEIYNPLTQSIDLSYFELHDANNYYTIPWGTIIPPQGYLVIAQDLAAFNTQFPFVTNVIGGWSFGLGGDGEWVALLTAERCWVDGLKYNDSPPWPIEADGNGPTLALIDPGLDNKLPGSWAPSTWGGALFGTPGGPNLIPDPCQAIPADLPVINEIHYNADTAFDTGNWIELFYDGVSPVDISNWLFMDQDSVFTIPIGTIMQPGEYLVLAEEPDNANLISLMATFGPDTALGPLGFQLHNDGERLLLYSQTRCLVDSVDYDDKAPWPDEDPDPTIGLLDSQSDNALGQNWTTTSGYGSPGGPNDIHCAPGNVYDYLQLWLKADLALNADDPVSLWPDAGPFNHDASQLIVGDEPLYKPQAINQHGSIVFDGSADWLKINALASTLSGNSAVFTVFKPELDTDDGYYLSTHFGGSNRIKLGHRLNGELIYDDDAPTMATGSFYDRWTMTTVNITTSQLQGWVNGQIAPSWDNPNVAGADRVSIGQEYDGQGNDNQTSNHWKGELAEMIVLAGTASDSLRWAVESYYSIKYGLTIPVANHLYYSYASHPNALAGIAKDAFQCLNQTQGQSIESTSILHIHSPTDLQHGDYLVWGHNGGSVLLANASLNVGNGIKERMNRVWRFSEQGDVGSITFDLDLTTSGWENYDSRALVLLVDEDGDFSNALAYPYGSPLDLKEGDFVSLGVRSHVHLEAKALLSGPFDLINGLMWDSLRVLNLIPLTDPYENNWTMESALLDNSGPNAIVDWLQLQIRQLGDSAIIYTQSVLVQRDGGMVDISGDSSLFIPLSPNSYFVSIQHRNHLGTMLRDPINLTENLLSIDFRADTCLGSHPQKEVQPGLFGLWAGNANGDANVSFQGGLNDPGTVFLKVLSDPANFFFARNFISSGYDPADTNLDGSIIFQGGNADTNPIFLNVLSHPANVTFSRNHLIEQQLP